MSQARINVMRHPELRRWLVEALRATADVCGVASEIEIAAAGKEHRRCRSRAQLAAVIREHVYVHRSYWEPSHSDEPPVIALGGPSDPCIPDHYAPITLPMIGHLLCCDHSAIIYALKHRADPGLVRAIGDLIRERWTHGQTTEQQGPPPGATHEAPRGHSNRSGPEDPPRGGPGWLDVKARSRMADAGPACAAAGPARPAQCRRLA